MTKNETFLTAGLIITDRVLCIIWYEFAIDMISRYHYMVKVKQNIISMAGNIIVLGHLVVLFYC